MTINLYDTSANPNRVIRSDRHCNFLFIPDEIGLSGDVDLLAVLPIGVGPLLDEARRFHSGLDLPRVRHDEEVDLRVDGDGRRHLCNMAHIQGWSIVIS